MKKSFLFILLFFFAIFPRFIFLGNVPAAINDDELHYTLNAKSFFLTGKDITGKISPLDILLFKYPSGETAQSELTYFLEMPFFGPFNFSLAGLALPNVLFGILTVGLIYLITKKLFDEKIALIAAFLAALNPWLIFVSRTSYEAGIATALFLSIIYLLLVAKGWKILLIMPIMILAFYSYIGTKLIFIPFMLLSIFFVYFYVNKRRYLVQYSLLFAFSLLLTLFFVFQLRQASSARLTEILTPNNPEIIKQVSYMKATTIKTPLMYLSENKYYVYLTILAKNTFNVFSPHYLFAGSDRFYLAGIHGIFYYLDILFLGIGGLILFSKNRRLFLFLIFLIFLGSLTEAFHNPNGDGVFTPHVALTTPFLLMIISFGINRVLNFRNSKYFYPLLGIIILSYGVLFINFCVAYFLRFPLQEGTFEMQNRTLAKYLSLVGNSKDAIAVYAGYPKSAFEQFLFYSNVYNKNNIKTLNQSLISGKFVFENVSFLGCSDYSAVHQDNLIIDDLICGRKLAGALNIVQLSDSGARYYIYNDKVCSKYNLPHFVADLKLSDLALERLSEKDFCQKFIVSY